MYRNYTRYELEFLLEKHLTNKTKRHLKKLLNGGSLALYSTYAGTLYLSILLKNH